MLYWIWQWFPFPFYFRSEPNWKTISNPDLELDWELVGPASCLILLPCTCPGGSSTSQDDGAMKPKPQLATLSQRFQVNHSPNEVASFLCSVAWGEVKRNSPNLPDWFWDWKLVQLLYVMYNLDASPGSTQLFVHTNAPNPITHAIFLVDRPLFNRSWRF